MAKRIRRIAIGVDLEPLYKHHTAVTWGILKYAESQGWECSLEPFIDTNLDLRKFDGLIARVTASAARCIRRTGIPAVNVWVNSPDKSIPRVEPDQHAVGRLAASHLLERGYRRFGYLGQVRNKNCDYHLEGMRQVLSRGKLPLFKHFVAQLPRDTRAWSRLQNSLRKWVDSWRLPIGVFVVQDLVCRYLANVIVEKGLRIPEDVALVGCGDEELLCEGVRPSMTSVAQANERIGVRAAELLARMMEGEAQPKAPIRIRPVGLVMRRSTEAFVAADPLLSLALRYIEEHCQQPLGVDDVVDQVPLSRRSLERRFRDALGWSIHDQIARARIAFAKRLLVDPERPLKAVALEAGFSNSKHFFRVFQQFEGLSPNAYRSEMLPDSPE